MSAPPSRASRLAILGLAFAAAAAWLVPYAWMVLTSFKTLPEIVAHPTAPLPEHLDGGAYREVFATLPVARYMGVTIFMAVAIAGLQIMLALPAGYALAKLHFVGKRFAFGTVLACLLVPAQATFVPVFLMFARVHLVNTMAALVLPFAARAVGTFLVRQALLGGPDEIIEA